MQETAGFTCQVRSQKDFEEKLKEYVYEHFHIDIVHLINTRDENVLYVKQHSRESDRQILVKNMDDLYQDFLGNTMSILRYSNMIGTRYKYLLDEVWQHTANHSLKNKSGRESSFPECTGTSGQFFPENTQEVMTEDIPPSLESCEAEEERE